jgi:hypothetical protein
VVLSYKRGDPVGCCCLQSHRDRVGCRGAVSRPSSRTSGGPCVARTGVPTTRRSVHPSPPPPLLLHPPPSPPPPSSLLPLPHTVHPRMSGGPCVARTGAPTMRRSVHPTPYVPHPTPQYPHPNTHTPNPHPQTPNPKPQTPNPKPKTPNPTPQTQNPTPKTPHPRPQPQTQTNQPRTNKRNQTKTQAVCSALGSTPIQIRWGQLPRKLCSNTSMRHKLTDLSGS